MLGLTLHPPGGGGGMQRLIYILFIVIFKASMYCQNTFIIVYLILTNKFLLKLTKIKNILFIISAQERLGVACKQKEIYRIGQNELKNVGISDIGKDPILCIPSTFVNQQNCHFALLLLVKQSKN